MSTRIRTSKKHPSGASGTAVEAPSVRIKIVDVAREAGVSITTVSHALNGRGQVDPKTRAAVRGVAERLGYRPNRHAQQLRTGASHIVALVSSMPFSVAGGPSRLGFMMEIAAVAAGVALARGLALILVPPSERGAGTLEQLGLDGALVIEPAAGDPQLQALSQRGVPVVTIGRVPGDDGQACIDLRAQQTTLQLLEHLRTQGARRIALLTGAQARSPYLDALAAYEAYATRRRMKPCIATADEAQGEEAGRAATLQLLATHPDIDAICAPVDAFAVGAARALRELGRRVPQDVMLATRYDGNRARQCEPPVTALDLHLETVATQAIELLMERMRGERGRRVVEAPEATLVERESTRSS